MTAEQQARFDDIRNGPWRESSQFARQHLLMLSEPELKRHLRQLYGDEIKDKDEINFRESFDQVLEELQLMELAVAFGFLPLDAVRSAAEIGFAILLASGTHDYVKLYDFVLVRQLASRLGINLQIGSVQPPAIDPQAEARYAIFLATHYEFIANGAIRTFTMFMDDVHFGERKLGADVLKRWVSGERLGLSSDEQAVITKGSLGLIQFTETLGDFFLQIPVQEQRYFGLAYGYWLSRFFGLRRLRNQYEHVGVSFEDVRFDPALLAPELDSQGAEAERKRFHDRVHTLSVVWDETRQLIDTLNQPLLGSDEAASLTEDPHMQHDPTGEVSRGSGVSRGKRESSMYRGTPEDRRQLEALRQRTVQLCRAGQYLGGAKVAEEVLALSQRVFGMDHPDTATALHGLAALYKLLGQYDKSEQLYQRAVAIREEALGDHPKTAMSLNNLAELYWLQGKYAKAEPLCNRALEMKEKTLGTDDPATARTLNNLAELYKSLGKYSRAEPLYMRALAILTKALGEDHPNIATALNNLAELYRVEGKYGKAEPLYVRALEIHKKAFGVDHQNTAISLNNLGELYGCKTSMRRRSRSTSRLWQ